MSTLVYDPFYRVMPAFFGFDLEELIALKHPDAWRLFEEGVRDEAWFVDNFFLDRRPFDIEGLKRSTFEAYSWLEGMEELCAELSERGVVLHFVSNYSDWYREIESRLGLSRFGRWTFVSCHEGLRKPDVAAFERALALAEMRAEGAIFVDDNAKNVAVAAKMGMDAIRFEKSGKLREAFGQRGLLD